MQKAVYYAYNSATPTEKKPSRPDWREEYVGQVGLLRLFESERKHPWNNYAVFLSDDGSWLKTSCGEYRIAGYSDAYNTEQPI